MRNDSKTKRLTILSFCMAVNVIGSFIALTLRLPIYMDSIGTVMAAMLLGPKYAVVAGVCGSLISGTFDVYSLYFAPIQIATGLFAGIAFNKGLLKGRKLLFGVMYFAIPTSIIGALICVFMFGGITSSGSSYILQFLSTLGMNKILAAFLVQLVTDYIDEFIATTIGIAVLNTVPAKYIALRSR